MYLDSIRIFNSTIDILVMLGLIIIFHTISYHKDAISKKYLIIVELRFLKNANNIIVLNINNYYSIHTKRILNMIIIT